MTGEYFIVEASPWTRGAQSVQAMNFSTKGFNDYPPQVINPLSYDIAISADNRLAGEALRRSGSIQIQLTDKENYVGSLNFQGRPVLVKQGDFDTASGSYTTVMNARMDEVRWDQSGVMNITLKSSREAFRKQVIGGIYSGLTGADENLNGQNKPLCFGRCLNVRPTLIDSVNLVYQVHDGPVEAIPAVYFNGYPATLTNDYTVDLAAGTITLTGSPLGIVTADVDGDNTGGWHLTQAEILQRVAEGFAGWTDGFNAQSLTDFNTAVGGNCNLYIGTGDYWTLDDVCTFLIGGSSGYWTVNRNREMVIGAARSVDLTNPVETWTNADISAIRLIKTIQPFGHIKIKAAKNWNVHFVSDIAGALIVEEAKPTPDDTRMSFLESEWRVQEYDLTDPAYPDALDHEWDSPYWTITDALRALDNVVSLHTSMRDVYQVTRLTTDLTWELFDVVRIVYPDWGLDVGKNFFIIGMNHNMQSSQVTYTLWG